MTVPPQPLPRIPRSGEVIPLMKEIIEKFRALHKHIFENITPSTATFDNVIRPLAELHNSTLGDVETIYMLEDVAPSQEAREASIEARKLFLEAEAEWMARADLFRLIQAVHNKKEALDHESRLWIEQELLEYTLIGHGRLEETQIEAYRRGKSALEELTRQYCHNLSSDRSGVWFTESELDGIPLDQIAMWKLGTETANQGQRFIPFANRGLSTVTSLATSSETRKKMFIANEQRLPENVALVKEIAILRDSQARLLGYSSHAAFRMQKMVATVEWVDGFLQKLSHGLKPTSKQRLNDLQRLRVQDLKDRGLYHESESKSFPPWDVPYYTRLLGLTRAIDHRRISEYFPLQTTVPAMLKLFSFMLQLRFDQVSPQELAESLVWHEDVQVWSVWDERSDIPEFLGYLYLDLLWRESKHQGFQNRNMQSGYLTPEGSRHYPSTILICAFPPATERSCAILKHDEVVLLFHELGHGIHDLVSKTKYARHHGPRLADDFCETPSILLENWVWMKDVLQEISCHYTSLSSKYLAAWRADHPGASDPPKQIPGELVEGLIERRNTSRANVYEHQLIFALFDMKLHNPRSPDDIRDIDISNLWSDLRAQIQGIDDPQSRVGGLSNPNIPIMISGPGGGLYGYLSATSFAQDIFASIFEADPKSQDAWNSYREGILGYGGSHGNEMKMLEDLLGRPPNPKALLNSLKP